MKTVIQDLFNDENIVQDTFEMSVSLYKQEEYDSLEIEYRDPITWKTETVLCALPDSYGERPETLAIPGVTDRNLAFRLGMRILSEKKFQRREVRFSTGIEGFLSTYGDFVKVSQDTFGIDEDTGGFIEAVSVDHLTAFLSVPVSFTDGFAYRLSAKGKDGTVFGPYVATAGADEYTVILDATISTELNFANHSEPPVFIFGRSVSFSQDCVITGLAPNGGDEVDVTAILYDSRVYDYDAIDAPAIEDSGSLIAEAPLPVVTGVDIAPAGGDKFIITWTGSQDAKSYIVQISDNPEDESDIADIASEDWETIGQTTATSFETTILLESIFIRVAGVNVGQGPWSYHEELIEGDARVTEGTETEPLLTRVTEDGKRRTTHPN